MEFEPATFSLGNALGWARYLADENGEPGDRDGLVHGRALERTWEERRTLRARRLAPSQWPRPPGPQATSPPRSVAATGGGPETRVARARVGRRFPQSAQIRARPIRPHPRPQDAA